MAGKLSEEQRVEIVRRYEAGETKKSLSLVFSVTPQTVDWHLRKAKVPIRGRAEASRPRWHPVTESITKARWEELYYSPNWLSPAQIAQHLGLDANSVRRRMKALGFSMRTVGEQVRINMRLGRQRKPCGPHNPITNPGGPPAGCQLKRLSKQTRLKMSASHVKPEMVSGCCAWCGAPIQKLAHNWHRVRHHFCGLDHAIRHRVWKQNGPSDIRPLILARLRDLLREHPYKALPFTRETLEKAGATIGAGEAEILEVMLEGRP